MHYFCPLYTRKLDLRIRKKLVNCYILSITIYGAENWTLQKVNHNKYRESFETGVRGSKEVLCKIQENRNNKEVIRLIGLVISYVGTDV